MESSVEVLNGCIELFITIRKEYKIRCRCCTKPLYFYAMKDFIEHWMAHHKPKLSWFSRSRTYFQSGSGNSNCCQCPEYRPTLSITPNSRSFELQCNACKDRNVFKSMEDYISHFLERHSSEGVQNKLGPSLVGEGTIKEELTVDNELVNIVKVSGRECSDAPQSETEEVSSQIERSSKNFASQIHALEHDVSGGNGRSKGEQLLSMEQLSYCGEISIMGQIYSIEDCQEVCRRAELEGLTIGSVVEIDTKIPLDDNRNIQEECIFGRSLVENKHEIIEACPELNSDARKSPQKWFFGNQCEHEMAKSSAVLNCNFGHNVFDAKVMLEKLELNRLCNENRNNSNKSMSEKKRVRPSNEKISGRGLQTSVSPMKEVQKASNRPSPNPEITSIRNEIEVASITSTNASMYSSSRPNSTASGRKRKPKHSLDTTECDGECSQSNFRRRRKRFKANQEPISCPICSKFFSQMHSYNFHMKKFHPPTVCTLCNIDFATTKGILQHLNTHRNELSCPICHEDESWCNKLHLKKHFHLLNCRKCDFFTTDEIELQAHQIVCGQFRCDSCNAVFGDARAYRRHSFSYHDNDEPFECPYCAEKFKFLNSMRNHQRTCPHFDGN